MITPSPIGQQQSIVITVSVCLSVCLSVREHISRSSRPIFTSFLCMLGYLWPWPGPPLAIRCVLPVLWMTSCMYTFSALTLLVGRQEGHPACKRTERRGAGVVICLERGADLHTAQLMPLTLTISCFSEIRIGLASLVPAHLGGPRQRAVKRVCVCVCVCVCHVCT